MKLRVILPQKDMQKPKRVKNLFGGSNDDMVRNSKKILESEIER